MLRVTIVRDNVDFYRLFCCCRVNYENTTLAAFNMLSLYTNIMHAYGLDALSYWIDKHPGSFHENFNKQFALKWRRCILQNNNCKFNNEFVVQINNTAMGALFAPTYVMLTFYKICIDEFGETLGQFILENWGWFLDDCKTLGQN